MQNLTLSIPHQLTRAEARRRIQDGITQLQQQYGGMVGPIDQTWTGDSLAFKLSPMGQSISGKLDVEDSAVRVEVTLPWMLAMLGGAVKQQIEQQGRELLGHKEPGAEGKPS